MSTKMDVNFVEVNQSFEVSFGEVQTASDGGFERGYDVGFRDGLSYGVVDVSTLPNFNGVAAETDGEYYYKSVSVDGVWTASNVITFEGEENTQYLITAELKCAGVTNFGIGFRYEDGTTELSPRYTDSGYKAVGIVSTKDKKVVGIGYTYGSNGAGYVRNFTCRKLVNGLEGDT